MMNPLTWLLDTLRQLFSTNTVDEPDLHLRAAQPQSMIINPRATSTKQQVIRPLEFVVTDESMANLIRPYPYINIPPSREVTSERGGQ